MNNEKDYLSEFEREFELNDFSSEYESETGTAEEFEQDFSGETNDEYELDGEYESNDEYEFEQDFSGETNDEYEFEDEQADSELENYLQEYNSRDQEFEDRIYSALSGEYENSFEMEQEIDRVLYELQMDNFFGGLSKALKKVGGIGRLAGIAKKFIPGGTIAGLAKLAGGDLRGLLKSDLLKKGLSMAANAYLPGVGGLVAGKLLNSETAAAAAPPAADPRAQAKQAVQVAKTAYRNLAGLLPNLRPGNVPNQLRRFSRQALSMARSRHPAPRGRRRPRKVIRLSPGATVVVKRDRIIIY